MRYSPRSSVTAVRDFSIRTGLVASTVTPGSTAPEESVTTPETLAALVPCADAQTSGRRREAAAMNPTHAMRYMEPPPRCPMWSAEVETTPPRRGLYASVTRQSIVSSAELRTARAGLRSYHQWPLQS